MAGMSRAGSPAGRARRALGRAVRWGLRGLLAVLALGLLLNQLRLYENVDAADMTAELAWVRSALARGEATRMQSLFPEGYLFSHALHGLAWIDHGLARPPGDPLRTRAVEEARAALAAVESAEGRAPFPATLAPGHGIFHAGWSNWLRAGILVLAPPTARDPALVAAFRQRCDAIAAAFSARETPFLEAYPQAAWPVDSTVALASLAVHDRIEPPRYQATIATWLTRARARLDPGTGLLPHRVDPASGRPIEPARGSSQSVILRFLPEIDPGFAREQYGRFRHHLVVTRLGLPGVREFPAGVGGSGDVDSGPLIFGVSASATVVARGAAVVNGDGDLARALTATMAFFGLPLTLDGQRAHGFGLLPVGDAFIVWAHAARSWTVPAPSPASWPPRLSRAWRLPMHAIALVLGLLAYRVVRGPRRRWHPGSTDSAMDPF